MGALKAGRLMGQARRSINAIANNPNVKKIFNAGANRIAQYAGGGSHRRGGSVRRKGKKSHRSHRKKRK